MLIVELKRHFPARIMEWYMAGLAFSWGLYTALHPQLFEQPETAAVLRGMKAMAGDFPPSAVWGVSTIILGLVRACALFINGSYTRTPMIRLVMSFASAFVWTQVVVGLLKSGVPNWGLVMYSGAVVMDVVSTYRAATDTVYAEKVRHDTKGTNRGNISRFVT